MLPPNAREKTPRSSGAPVAAEVERPRALIAGRYELFGAIESGGMATVHFGRLLGPGGFSRTVAIKRLHPQLAKESVFVSMFLDEVRLASRIQHPNVVATLDAVEEGDELFLVMEYVHGESLAQLIALARASNLPIPFAIACSILSGALHGLHAVHEAIDEEGAPLGIIHRDVSPQNIIVGADGVTRVLDFGIARAVGRLQITRDGRLKGKTAYLAPERIQGQEGDRRTDVYGAAVVLWETLTSGRLFDGENDAIILAQVLASPVQPPSCYVSAVPEALDEIVLRGLDRDPEKRFTTAREMALAIQRLGHVAPSDVSDWVMHVAADSLAARARRLAGLSSLPRSDAALQAASTRALSPQPAGGTSASGSLAADLPGAAGRGRAWGKALGFALGLGILAGAVAWARQHFSSSRPEVIEVIPALVTELSSATTPPSSPPPVAPASALNLDPLTAIALVAASAAPHPVRPEPASGAARPRSTSGGTSANNPQPARERVPSSRSAAPASAAPISCQPPYTVDAAGVRHFKVDCIIDRRR